MHSSAPPSSSETVLAAFRQKDAEDLRAFARPIWEKAYSEIISTEQIDYMLSKGYSAETLLREMSEQGVMYRWIQKDSRRAGFLACEPDLRQSSAFLHKFYVEPSFWGKGLAHLAMEELVPELSCDGIQTLHLRVNRENQRAIRFYESCGFGIDGEDCLPIGNGFVMDDYLMSRSLH